MVINDYNGFIHGYLVGGLEPRNFEWLSHHIGNVIIPTDERIFFRGVETTNQNVWKYIYPSKFSDNYHFFVSDEFDV
jgi:hypothetical protein